MNLEHVAILLSDNITTISASFDNGNKLYTFKVTRTLASCLEKGRKVLVYCANGYRVAKVEEVHEEPQIDIESDFKYRWAFQLVYDDELERLEKQEKLVHEALVREQRKKVREQALASLGLPSVDKLLEKK